MNRIKEFYFSEKLSPETALVRAFLTGVFMATIIGILLIYLGIA